MPMEIGHDNAYSLPNFEHLTPPEARLFMALAHGNSWLRAVLCTLARRGAAYREANAARAQEILALLAPLPLFKAGQFLFDLMEWEDFMLDGPAPPVLPAVLDASALEKLAELLRALPGYLDGAYESAEVVAATAPGAFVAVDDANLPDLQPTHYLYQDVVLGVVYSAILAQETAGSDNGREDGSGVP